MRFKLVPYLIKIEISTETINFLLFEKQTRWNLPIDLRNDACTLIVEFVEMIIWRKVKQFTSRLFVEISEDSKVVCLELDDDSVLVL